MRNAAKPITESDPPSPHGPRSPGRPFFSSTTLRATLFSFWVATADRTFVEESQMQEGLTPHRAKKALCHLVFIYPLARYGVPAVSRRCATMPLRGRRGELDIVPALRGLAAECTNQLPRRQCAQFRPQAEGLSAGNGHRLYKGKGPERVSLARESVPDAWGPAPRNEWERAASCAHSHHRPLFTCFPVF